MSERTALANGRRSKIHAVVSHVFAHQKHLMDLFIRTIGLARAKTKIGATNLACNFTRYLWHEGQSTPS
jgi:hypothetical protein